MSNQGNMMDTAQARLESDSRGSAILVGIFGAVTVVVGVLAMIWPGKTVVVLALLFGIQLVVAGIIRFVEGLARTEESGGTRTMLALLGVLSVIVQGFLVGRITAKIREDILIVACAALMASMALISLQDVTLTFGGPPLLDGVNLQIEAGEMVGLLGRNGAGRTTTMDLTAALEQSLKAGRKGR